MITILNSLRKLCFLYSFLNIINGEFKNGFDFAMFFYPTTFDIEVNHGFGFRGNHGINALVRSL